MMIIFEEGTLIFYDEVKFFFFSAKIKSSQEKVRSFAIPTVKICNSSCKDPQLLMPYPTEKERRRLEVLFFSIRIAHLTVELRKKSENYM